MPYLENIKSPSDIKNLNIKQLEGLCDEIRNVLISTVSENGGHLASNLGVVELTVAMHKVFNSPHDQFVWDVGHQCYTHKLLTGRYDDFSTLRTEGGIGGFTRPNESEHDIFSSGHSSTAVSAACGLAKANSIKDNKHKVLAVVGDGALTGGMVYEAFNNVAHENDGLIVILNDNKMSISENVGSLSQQLAVIRSSSKYSNLKSIVQRALINIPFLGKYIVKFMEGIKRFLRNRIFKTTFFENFGFRYFGPLDGHDLSVLIDALKMAKTHKHSVLIHINTVKGKGYDFAEQNPTQYHGIGRFNINTGETNPCGETFSDSFGQALCDFAQKDSRVAAITAAMTEGTGLSKFAEQFPRRFFDVGIAEPHAVTFASGLAKNNMLPVFVVYSTFLQRCYDQIVHDCAMQPNLKVIFAIDRAGFVGEDGESHQGVFDVAFLNTVPNITVFSPSTFEELQSDIYKAMYREKSNVAIRYPRGCPKALPADYTYSSDCNYSIYGDENASTVIVTYGRLFAEACEAYAKLKEQGIALKILKLNCIKPIDQGAVNCVLGSANILFYEEGVKNGGVGEHFASLLLENGYNGSYKIIAIDDGFVHQASIQSQMAHYKLDSASMLEQLLDLNGTGAEVQHG